MPKIFASKFVVVARVYIYIFAIVVIIILAILSYLFFYKSASATVTDKVCMSVASYENLKYSCEKEQCTRQQSLSVKASEAMYNTNQTTDRAREDHEILASKNRDYRVLTDPLYPPLNRTDTVTQNKLISNINERNMYIPTNDQHDQYRLVGYLVNQDNEKDIGGNTWKLFARQKDRNSSDFYMIPANNNYDVKIHITDGMILGTRLRDIYSIPDIVEFKSPMLNTSRYNFIEIPKSDLSTSRFLL